MKALGTLSFPRTAKLLLHIFPTQWKQERLSCLSPGPGKTDTHTPPSLRVLRALLHRKYKKSQQKQEVILLKECIPTWKHAREDTAAKPSVYFFCRGISGMSRVAPSFCQTMGWALQISSSLQKAESRKTQRNPKSTHRVLGSCLSLTLLGWLLEHHEHCSIRTPRCRLWPEKADLVWVRVSEARIVRLNSVTQPSPLKNWSYRLRFV